MHRRQAAVIQQYARRRGREIVKTYADPGKSGLVFKNRAGLKRLLEDVPDGGSPESSSFDLSAALLVLLGFLQAVEIR